MAKAQTAANKILLSWQAPARPHPHHSRQFWTTALSILALVILILLFAQEWLLIVALVSLAFLYYILSSVEPRQVSYRLSQRGLILPDRGELPWELFSGFYYRQHWQNRLLHLRLQQPPFEIQLVIPADKEAALDTILAKHLPRLKYQPTSLDKIASWLRRQLPLED